MLASIGGKQDMEEQRSPCFSRWAGKAMKEHVVSATFSSTSSLLHQLLWLMLPRLDWRGSHMERTPHGAKRLILLKTLLKGISFLSLLNCTFS
ncbi:hypothetical protein P7K49_025956 [Saguinus oedipus]|uniref:Uncharacterized protein n=1 Tax=Saguinus oedipus TaxID=9490 RepID=A0ABQ9UKZ7_SAGOE|nr:hypothetical protein P7K49_025956 [Saguinus oedipus]